MSFLKALFSEGSQISTMRVMAVFSLIVGAGISFYCIFNKCELNGATPLAGLFVGAAFGGKVAQKFAETKDDK